MPPSKKNKNAKSEIRERYVFETREELLEWIRDHLSINVDEICDVQDYYSTGKKIEVKIYIEDESVYEENIDVWTTHRKY